MVTKLFYYFVSILLCASYRVIVIANLDISDAEKLGRREDPKTIEEKEWVASDDDPIPHGIHFSAS